MVAWVDQEARCQRQDRMPKEDRALQDLNFVSSVPISGALPTSPEHLSSLSLERGLKRDAIMLPAGNILMAQRCSRGKTLGQNQDDVKGARHDRRVTWVFSPTFKALAILPEQLKFLCRKRGLRRSAMTLLEGGILMAQRCQRGQMSRPGPQSLSRAKTATRRRGQVMCQVTR